MQGSSIGGPRATSGPQMIFLAAWCTKSVFSFIWFGMTSPHENTRSTLFSHSSRGTPSANHNAGAKMQTAQVQWQQVTRVDSDIMAIVKKRKVDTEYLKANGLNSFVLFCLTTTMQSQRVYYAQDRGGLQEW